MISLFGIVAGLLLLILGGASLVTGASQVAVRLGISPMIVGLTIVGFGTSTPELVANISAALYGESGLAFGNVVGSNITNLALVLGAAALLQSIEIQGKVVRREVPLLLLVTTITTVMALDHFIEGDATVIGRSDAIVLILLFSMFVYITAQDVILTRRQDSLLVAIDESPLIATTVPTRWHWLYIVAGLGLLIAGGELTVRNSVQFAERLGVSTTLIGLFLVAVGTSMPELFTSIIAAWRKESDIALGNVLGSNAFNSLFVLPAGALISPVAVPAGGVYDLVVCWLLTAALIPIFLFGRARLSRGSGAVLLLSYAVYAVLRLSHH